jgi:hypothetical protein
MNSFAAGSGDETMATTRGEMKIKKNLKSNNLDSTFLRRERELKYSKIQKDRRFHQTNQNRKCDNQNIVLISSTPSSLFY